MLQWGTGFREVEESHHDNGKEKSQVPSEKSMIMLLASSYIYILSKGTGLIDVQSFNVSANIKVCLWLQSL